MRLALPCLAVLGLLSGCVSSPGPSVPRGDSSVITHEEIAGSLASNAYDAVLKLRSNFLMSRGATGLRNGAARLPTVFVDGIEHGPVSSLRVIPVSAVEEIRLLRSWEATTLFGTGHMAGTTRR
jgi:hypothetical protein